MSSTPIPAATLVLMRERGDAPPELLMVERASAMAFAAGAMVFPGGRIDPGDHALAATLDCEDGAARIAAIRETIEETGVAVGLTPSPTPAMLATIRARLQAGDPFGAVLAEANVTLDLDMLVPFARWLPNHPLMRIFDTMFYIARAPEDAHATVDHTENSRLLWIDAATMLADADTGRATIIYPTRRNLERLAQFRDIAAAARDAAAHPVRVITPFEEVRDGERWLCIPDDLGYPVTAERMAAAMRG